MRIATSCGGRSCGRQDPGVRPAIGGPNSPQQKTPRKTLKLGIAKSGTSLSPRMTTATLHSTGFIATPALAIGSPMPATTDLYMYIELHTRSAFSFLEGASVPEELAEVCHSYQMPAMALLDREGVYGAARFHLAMKKLGRQAHIGAEITSLLPHVPLRENSILPRVSLLCASREGYQNLCRLVTRMKLRAPKYPASLPRQIKREKTEELLISSQAASIGDLTEFSSGLICVTGGEEGLLAYALTYGGMEEARRTLEQL